MFSLLTLTGQPTDPVKDTINKYNVYIYAVVSPVSGTIIFFYICDLTGSTKDILVFSILPLTLIQISIFRF